MIALGAKVLVLSGLYAGCMGRIVVRAQYKPMPAQYLVVLTCTGEKNIVSEWLWSDKVAMKEIE